MRIPEQAAGILKVLTGAGYEAYVVGGCVRDTLLHREPEDWDITTDASPAEVKRLFRRTVDTGIAHGTVTVMMGEKGYEVTETMKMPDIRRRSSIRKVWRKT